MRRCDKHIPKENVLILANSLANKIGRDKRFGETTHHVDEIGLYEDYEDYGWTQMDISLLRVKEPFTGTVNFARLPPVLLNVKGEKVNNPICHKRTYQDDYFSDGKECLMLGWGKHIYQQFSKRRTFLHVIETHITTVDENRKEATISLDFPTISTKPDLALHVRNYSRVWNRHRGWNKRRPWNNVL